MKRKISIILSVVFVCIACMSFSSLAYAETEVSADAAVKNITEDWANANALQYTDTRQIPVIQANGKRGCMVAFTDSKTPKGYIIIYLSDKSETSISQFSFEGVDLYNGLIMSAKEHGYSVGQDEILYECGGIDYGVEVLFDAKPYLYTTADILSDIPLYVPATLSDDCLNDSEFDGLQLVSAYSIPDYGSFDLYATGESGYTNDCGPVAIVNMLNYWRNRGFTDISFSPIEIYDYIIAKSGFNNEGMTVSAATSAAKAYVKSVGYKSDVFDYWWDWYSYFKNDLKKDYTVLTAYQKGSYAHMVVSVGYKEYSYGNFLMVYTGYRYSHNDIAHLNFDAVDKIHGVKFKVK